MNDIRPTKFADSKDSETFLRQIAQAINNIERLLSVLPIYFGGYDPNGIIKAPVGALYMRVGPQSRNTQETTPKLYIKTLDGNTGWLSLLFTGSEATTDVDANRGSLYLKIPETGNAELYLKQSDDATPTGWKTL